MAENKQPNYSVGRSGPEKRPRGSPSGVTPLQQEKRAAAEPRDVVMRRKGPKKDARSRKRLSFTSGSAADPWSEIEDSALVEFILLHRPGQGWPSDRSPSFWDSAADFVRMRSGSGVLRTGKRTCMQS